jgi:hypothetical protein
LVQTGQRQPQPFDGAIRQAAPHLEPGRHAEHFAGPRVMHAIKIQVLGDQLEMGFLLELQEDIAILAGLGKVRETAPALRLIIEAAANEIGLRLVEKIRGHAAKILPGREGKPAVWADVLAVLIDEPAPRPIKAGRGMRVGLRQEHLNRIGRQHVVIVQRQDELGAGAVAQRFAGLGDPAILRECDADPRVALIPLKDVPAKVIPAVPPKRQVPLVRALPKDRADARFKVFSFENRNFDGNPHEYSC